METIYIMIAFLILLLFVFILAQILVKPIKLLWKLLINSALGLITLILFNFISSYFDFALPINLVTILIAGFLGLPGIILLTCFQFLIR